MEALAARDEPGFEARLTQLLVYRERFWSEDYRVRMTEVRALGTQAVSDLLALADDGQRRHLQERLAELSRDLGAIACA